MPGPDRDTRPGERLTPAERVLRRSGDATMHGRPLSDRARQAQRTVEGYLRGGNPPRWMERIAEIDARTARELRELGEAHARLRERHRGDAAAFARAWRAFAAARDFDEVNALIAQHNEWYPVERDLPFDPRTGEYLSIGGRSFLRRPLGAAWVLEQFPAE
jgi:hypothetical protein